MLKKKGNHCKKPSVKNFNTLLGAGEEKDIYKTLSGELPTTHPQIFNDDQLWEISTTPKKEQNMINRHPEIIHTSKGVH